MDRTRNRFELSRVGRGRLRLAMLLLVAAAIAGGAEFGTVRISGSPNQMTVTALH